jgi:MFS family permease
MKKNKVTFCIYFIYFLFALLMHSILITIEQSIYIYAIDRSKSFILLIMNYVGVLLVPIFFTHLLGKIRYKMLILGLLGLIGIACLPVPLTQNIEFSKIIALFIGFVYACMRVATYTFLKTIHAEEKLYASIMNKLDAMFALGFVATWAIFATLVLLDTSWLYFYWLIASLILLMILLVSRTKFDTFEKTRLIQANQNQGAVLFAKIINPPNIYTSVLTFFKGILGSVWALLGLLRYSMVLMLVICMALLSIIQVHFTKYIPQVSAQFANIPSVDIYLMLTTFLAIFMGRIFASFLLPIFSTKYLLSIFLALLLGLVLLLSFQMEALLGATHILLFNDFPSAIWIIPLMGFVWGPVMPTLTAIVLHRINPPQTYRVAGLIIFVIYGIEVTWDKVSMLIFRQFNLSIGLIFTIVPVILLLIISLLFLNDLQHTDKTEISTNEANRF